MAISWAHQGQPEVSTGLLESQARKRLRGVLTITLHSTACPRTLPQLRLSGTLSTWRHGSVLPLNLAEGKCLPNP